MFFIVHKKFQKQNNYHNNRTQIEKQQKSSSNLVYYADKDNMAIEKNRLYEK